MIQAPIQMEKQMTRQIFRYTQTLLVTAFIVFWLNTSLAHAQCSCEIGDSLGSFIGMELTAKECPTEDANDQTRYTYIDQGIRCLGTQIGLFANWGDTVATPESIGNMYANYYGMRVLRNAKGTHFIMVHPNFDGYIHGLSMLNYPPGTISIVSSLNQLCVGVSENIIDKDNDGVIACKDCDDTNAEVGAGTGDSDGDGIPECTDCDNENESIKAGKGIDQDEDGYDACTDCNDEKKDQFNICLSCTKVRNPIDYFSGAMTHDLDLISLPGAPIPLGFTLKYDSHENVEDPLGMGWSHNHAVKLGVFDKSVMVMDRSQKPPVFVTYDNGNTYSPGGTTKGSLIKTQDQYIYTRSNAQIWTFDLAGRLIEKKDPHGLLTVYEYDGTGKLITITDPSQRTLTINYFPQGTPEAGLIMTVEDPGENIYSFSYINRALNVITYPDSDADHTNNPKVLCLYEDFPSKGLTNGGDATNMTKLIDARGNALSWSYDTSDRAVLTSGPLGDKRLDLSYDSPGSTVVVNTRTEATTYTYDQNTRTHTATGPGCSSCSNISIRKYDPAGLLIETEDGEGYITQYLNHDKNGNPETIIKAVGTPKETTTHYTYHPKFNKKTSQKQPGTEGLGDRETIYTYDESTGDLLSMSQKGYSKGAALTVTTQYTYNARGQVTSINGPREDVNDTTIITYDPVTGFLQQITQPLSGTSTFSDYDKKGYPLTVTGPNGNATNLVYDRQGRTTQVTNPDGGKTELVYDSAGNLTRVIQPMGNTITYEYDYADQLSRVTDNLGNQIRYFYDKEGNQIRKEIRDENNALKTYLDLEYDSYKRLEKVIYPDSSFTEYGYDKNNNRTMFKDPADKTTSYTYDELNQLSTHTDAMEGVTTYTYDINKNLSSVTDANDNTTSFKYDDFGRLLSKTSPDTGKTLYTYDLAGNLIEKTDARGLTTTFEYDAQNRLLAVLYPNPSQNINYTYDQGTNGKGMLTDMRDASGTTKYMYGPSGKVAKEIKVIAGVRYVTSYSYDLNGNLVSLTYPDGSTVQYGYNAHSQLEQVSTSINNQSTVLADSILFAPFGGMTHMSLNNGIDRTAVYDDQYRLSQITDGTISNRQYGYDPSGNIDQITDNLSSNKNQGFVYNDLNRLEQATGIYGTINYGYDPVGNRTTKAVNGQIDIYTYKPETNLLNQVAGLEAKNLTHDKSGNIIKSNNKALVYNTDNRLIQIIENNALKGAYTYNGKGQRIKKTIGNTTIVYHYDINGNTIAISDLQGNLIEKYVYILGQRIAKIDLAYQPLDIGDVNADNSVDQNDALMIEQYLVGIMLLNADQLIQADVTLDGKVTAQDAMVIKQIQNNLRRLPPGPATETVFYFHNDHLGTPLALTDQNGVKVWEADYLPFGGIFENVGTANQGFRFPGQYLDGETGLHYNWHRYYDPDTGRYLTPDPIGLAGGINPFVYSLNNPANFIDPLGLYTEIIIWQPIDWWTSSFGHVSSNVNGVNYSWGPNGWDTRYPKADDYANRQVSFRSGVGVILNLTPEQEQRLQECYKRSRDEYSPKSNNCADPHQDCLSEVLGLTLTDTLFPVSFGNALLDSPFYEGSTFYNGPDRKFGDDAPWAKR